MADISNRITRKSLAAKKKAAIKTIRQQAKEKIRQVKIEYAMNPEKNKAKVEEKQQKRELRLQKSNARISYNQRSPRPYSLGEEIFNGVTHGIGAGLSVAGIATLAIHAYFDAPQAQRLAYISCFSLFGVALFFTYLMSTLNHSLNSLNAKKVFNILTKDAIYLMIAATASCFALKEGYGGVIVASWIVAGCLIALYSALHNHIQGFTVLTYMVFGWIIAITFGTSLIASGQNVSGVLLIVSAVVYTAGTVFAILRNFKWAHCVFHFFTLAASIIQFFSMYKLF